VIDGHKYPFQDPEDAARFEQLAEDLRCPKCQNQNLADSNAPVAADLRDKVYELMQEGKSDDEVVTYLVDRYGDFVRYKPPIRLDTLLLWGGPALLLLFGVLLLALLRRQQAQPVAELSAEERARLEALKSSLDEENK
jgi:cytochrome c-type biogenesis protein CcmH